MSWETVTIGTGKKTISAMQRGDVVSTIPTMKVEDKIVLNGVSTPVLSYQLDDREEQLLITVLPKGSKKKEKSDDKSNERAS
jgi:hypothetical protein